MLLHYRVTNIDDLTNVIIPHFEKYPLITQKQADFKLFKEIVQIIKRENMLNRKDYNKY